MVGVIGRFKWRFMGVRTEEVRDREPDCVREWPFSLFGTRFTLVSSRGSRFTMVSLIGNSTSTPICSSSETPGGQKGAKDHLPS